MRFNTVSLSDTTLETTEDISSDPLEQLCRQEELAERLYEFSDHTVPITEFINTFLNTTFGAI